MKPVRAAVRAALSATLLALVAGSLVPAAATPAAAATPPVAPADAAAAGYSGPVRTPCAPTAPDVARCLVLERATPATARPDVAGSGASRPAAPVPDGISPTQLRAIYGVSALSAPAGTTVGIVVPYDAPNVESNLATFRNTFGLPACTTANGCFRKVDQRGRTVPAGKSRTVVPKYGDAGWELETTLDTQAVSSMCPSCRILVVEADDVSLTASLGPAVLQAQALGATVISNSFAVPENATIFPADDDYWSRVTVPVFAGSGDEGFDNYGGTTGQGTAYYPASSPSVIAVGGTSANVSGNTVTSETAWSGAGSGCAFDFAPTPAQAAYFRTTGTRPDDPAYCDTQDGGAARASSDLSAMADPYAPGLPVYVSGGWTVAGGTSLSVQLMAALAAYAGPRRPGSSIAAVAYGLTAAGAPTGLVDLTSGTNNPTGGPGCGGERVCVATTGWDGPTGLGTPRGLSVFAPLLKTAATSILPGGTVAVSGSNFVPGETVAFTSGRVALGSAVVGYDGTWSGTVTAPLTARTSLPVTVTGSVSGLTASATLTVPAARLTAPTSLVPGQGFTAVATNFTPGESVTFHLAGAPDVVQAADAGGTARASFVVPAAAPTSLTVTATGGESGLTASAVVAVPAAFATLPSMLAAGATATLTGAAFAVGESVAVTIGSSRQLVVTTTPLTAGTNGTVSTTVRVPVDACPAAPTRVTLTGATSGRTASVYVTTPAADRLPSGCSIGAGTSFTSPGGQYRLTLQSDGNLVLLFGNRALWSTRTQGASPRLSLQSDGNLVLYAGGAARWSTGTSGGPGGRLVLQADGNLVLTDASGRVRWNRGVAGTDALQRGDVLRAGWYLHTASGNYRLTMQSDGNLVLVNAAGQAVWSTRTSGAGAYVTLQTDGNVVLYAGGRAAFTTRTGGTGVTFRVQTDGNLVVYNAAGKAVWHR